MLAVLRQRNFGLVWLAGLISLTGDWLLIVALPLFVYNLTGSAAATAVSVAVRVLPRFLLGSVAGVFVDRWDRRRTMIVTNLLLGLSLLPLLLVRSVDQLWLLYLASFVQSVLTRFFAPAESALVPQLVAKDDLVQANALNGLSLHFSRLVGPPLGGLIMATFGLAGAALLDAVSFFVAAGLVALVVPLPREAPSTAAAGVGGFAAWVAMWRELAAGFALVAQLRPITFLFIFTAIIGVGEGVMSALFAPFVSTVLGGGGRDSEGFIFGAMIAAQAVGGIVGNAAIGRMGYGIPAGRLLGFGALGVGTIDLLIFNAHHVDPGIALPLILMAIVGLPAAGFEVGNATLVQVAVSDAYRGRILGNLGAVLALSMLIGTGLGGALGDRLGIVATLTIDGIAFILGGALMLLALAPGSATRTPILVAEAES